MYDTLHPIDGLNEPVYTVSQLNAEVKTLLNETYPLVVVEGEVSGFYQHQSSRHCYFNLKDERSIIRAVMFAKDADRLNFEVADGMMVRIRAQLTLFEKRGTFQATVWYMEPQGEGALRQKYERLRAELQERGWFDPVIKKKLPPYPDHIVIVSSPKGAATRDIYVNIWRRYPPVKLTMQPTAVQGVTAPEQITAAIRSVNQMSPPPDLAIVTRGGGSLEDLEVFNSEEVARAIYESEVPIVSAIGHDIDFTISDYVADVRAPTPSTAAELVTPDANDLSLMFDELVSQLSKLISVQISQRKTVVDHLRHRIRSPKRESSEQQRQLNDLVNRLSLVQRNFLNTTSTRLEHSYRSLNQCNPTTHVNRLTIQITELAERLRRSTSNNLKHHQSQLTTMLRNLNAVSPLAVLERGYAVLVKPDDTEVGQLVHSVGEVTVGDELNARIADGTIQSTVTEVTERLQS